MKRRLSSGLIDSENDLEQFQPPLRKPSSQGSFHHEHVGREDCYDQDLVVVRLDETLSSFELEMRYNSYSYLTLLLSSENMNSFFKHYIHNNIISDEALLLSVLRCSKHVYLHPDANCTFLHNFHDGEKLLQDSIEYLPNLFPYISNTLKKDVKFVANYFFNCFSSPLFDIDKEFYNNEEFISLTLSKYKYKLDDYIAPLITNPSLASKYLNFYGGPELSPTVVNCKQFWLDILDKKSDKQRTVDRYLPMDKELLHLYSKYISEIVYTKSPIELKNDKTIVLAFFNNIIDKIDLTNHFEQLCAELRDDEQVLGSFLNKSSRFDYKQFGTEFFNNRKLILLYIQQCESKKDVTECYLTLTDELRNDDHIIIALIENIKYFPDFISNRSRATLLVGVKYNFNYEDLPHDWKQCDDFLLQIVGKDIPLFLKYNSNFEKTFIVKAITNSRGLLYQHLNSTLQQDTDVVVEFIKITCSHNLGKEQFKFLPENILDDKEFVLSQIHERKNKNLTQSLYPFLSMRLKTDKMVYDQLSCNFVRQMMNDSSNNCIPNVVFRDENFLYRILQGIYNGDERYQFVLKYHQHREFMCKLFSEGSFFLDFEKLPICEKLQNDREFMLLYVKHCGFGSNVDMDWRNDKEMLLRAKFFDFQSISVELKCDCDVVKEAIEQDAKNLKYLPEQFKNEEFLLQLSIYYDDCVQSIFIEKYLPEKFLKDTEFVRKVINEYKTDVNRTMLKYVGKNRDFMLSVLDDLQWMTLYEEDLDFEPDEEFIWKVVEKCPQATRNFNNNQQFMVKFVKKFPTLLENHFEYFDSRVLSVDSIREIALTNFKYFNNFITLYPSNEVDHFETFYEYLRMSCDQKLRNSYSLDNHINDRYFKYCLSYFNPYYHI